MKKKILFALFFIFCTSYLAFAGDVLWSSITNYTSTKANKTVPISSVEPIIAVTTASTCAIHIDSASNTGLTMAANTLYTIKTPSTVSNIVFSCTSSTGTTVTVIKQGEIYNGTSKS